MSTDEVIASDESPKYLFCGTRNLPVTHIHLYICLFFSCALMRRVFLSRFATTLAFLPLQLDYQLLFLFKTPLSSLFFHVLHAASQPKVLFLRFLRPRIFIWVFVRPSIRLSDNFSLKNHCGQLLIHFRHFLLPARASFVRRWISLKMFCLFVSPSIHLIITKIEYQVNKCTC